MILKHRDKELLRFDWIGDVRVRIDSVNDAERRFLPLDFGDERLVGSADALRYPLEDWLVSRSAPVGRHFMRNLMDSLGLNINSPSYSRRALEFSKGLSLNDVYWVVLSGFLQKRVADIFRFGRETDEKFKQSLAVATIDSNENVGVKSSSDSELNASEQKAARLILRNSAVTEEEIANQLGVTTRQVQRIIASLRRKVGLIRRGSDKVGEWVFNVDSLN